MISSQTAKSTAFIPGTLQPPDVIPAGNLPLAQPANDQPARRDPFSGRANVPADGGEPALTPVTPEGNALVIPIAGGVASLQGNLWAEATPAQVYREFLPHAMAADGEGWLGLYPTWRGGKPYPGDPVQSLEEIYKRVAQEIEASNDVFYVVCSQVKPWEYTPKSGKNQGKTRPAAGKDAKTAFKAKCIIVDIDAHGGDPEKAKRTPYASPEEAFDAARVAIEGSGILPPSAVVASGGGVHCYWTFMEPVPIADWKPVAEAVVALFDHARLITDRAVTTDAGRIIRLPGSMNYKDRGNPRPARLLNEGPILDYEFEDIRENLKNWICGTTMRVIPQGKIGAGARAPANDDVLGAKYQRERLPRNIDVAAQHCGLISKTLQTGGADHDNTLWSLMVDLASFCENPEQTAHRLSSGYAAYSESEVDQEIARRLREREAGGRGWTGCQPLKDAAKGAGCDEHCAGCANFNEKGPLSIEVVRAETLEAHNAAIRALYDPTRANRRVLEDARSVERQTFPSEEAAIAAISACYVPIKVAGKALILCAPADQNNFSVLNHREFRDALRSSYVLVQAGDKTIKQPAADFWLSSPLAPKSKTLTYEANPDGSPANVGEDKWNMWTGFAVLRDLGRSKIKRFIRHLWQVVCRRDKVKFKYLMRWLAWMVQNPLEPAEVAVVFKSSAEGSGKSTVSEVMCRIFGQGHAYTANSPEELVGQFTLHLDGCSLLSCEEAFFAGDPRAADKLKHVITGQRIKIEGKGKDARTMPNMLHIIMTTNHAWAIPAGDSARRWFVLEVSDEKKKDASWFGPIYADLDLKRESLGCQQFLDFLLTVKLGNWHPRNPPITAELVEQQERSLPYISQWLLDGVEAGKLPAGKSFEPLLGMEYTTAVLHDAYVAYRGGPGRGVESRAAFGKALRRVLGDGNFKKHVSTDLQRAKGYFIPGADELLALIDKAHGINRQV